MSDAGSSPGPSDPFLSDSSSDGSSELDLSKFYTASRDKKGFATTVRISVPPGFPGRAAELVARRIVPEYRTTADVYRDALVIGLEIRARQINDPSFTRAYSELQAEAELESVDIQMEASRRVVKLMSKILDEGGNEEARKAVEIGEKVIDQLADTMTRSQIQRLLERFQAR